MTIFDFQGFQKGVLVDMSRSNKQSTWPLLFISFGVTFVISLIVLRL